MMTQKEMAYEIANLFLNGSEKEQFADNFLKRSTDDQQASRGALNPGIEKEG